MAEFTFNQEWRKTKTATSGSDTYNLYERSGYYIIEKIDSSNEKTYYKGTGDPSNDWSNRTSLTYKDLNQLPEIVVK